MDADIDWCLSCNRRVEHGILYCCAACRPAARATPAPEPTSSTHHSWRAAHDERAAIHAWAANIPPGPPPPPPPSSDTLASSSSHPPNLIRPPRRAVPPSLSMTTPALLVPSSLPLPAAPRRSSSSGYASAGQTSRCTPATESSLALATPPPHTHPTPLLASSRRPSVIGGIFRGWAGPPHQLPALSSSRGSHAPVSAPDAPVVAPYKPPPLRPPDQRRPFLSSARSPRLPRRRITPPKIPFLLSYPYSSPACTTPRRTSICYYRTHRTHIVPL